MYAHELGHLVDLYHGQLKPTLLSQDPEWKKAWKTEIYGAKNALLSRYARKNESEGLAELYREIFEKGVEVASKRFPKCVKLLQAKGLL